MKTGCLEEALSQGPMSSVSASHLPTEDMEIEHPVEVDAERELQRSASRAVVPHRPRRRARLRGHRLARPWVEVGQ